MSGDGDFHAAAARVLDAQTTHKHLLARHDMQLYGLHQQAQHGDISTERPRCPINYDGKAKWDAWNDRRGMSDAAAKAAYVQLVHSILPEVAAPSISPASGSSDRPSATRRMRRYKPQAAGHASLPRLASLMLGSIAVLLLSTAAIIALSRWITDACRPLSSSVCHVWLSSHSVRVAMGWVSIGIAFGTLLQTNLLRSNILSVLYYVNLPTSSSTSSQHPPPSPELDLLASLGLVLGRVGTATADHPVMVFKPHQGSVVLGSARAIMEHPIEITADMHFRRFREPFPDPAQPGLMGIELVEEVPLPQWQCVYRKRKLQLKNNTPGFIKRFANAEYFDVIEESLWDKANQVLYVVGRNQSFAHLVLIEDFLLFRRHDDHDHWSQVTQTGACTVGGSFGFLRGTVEGFVRESYGKSVKKAQEHLVDRLDEECGARTSSMSTT